VLVLGAHKTRHEDLNYRVYQFAGAAHLRDVDAAEFELANPSSANNADWVPFFQRRSMRRSMGCAAAASVMRISTGSACT
jgi:hypothetical protein